MADSTEVDDSAAPGEQWLDHSAAPLLELRGIGRKFGTNPPIHAVRSVDLTVYRGEWVAVVGPSGSGKSTLLNILGFLDKPTTGAYWFDTIDTTTLTDRQRAGLRGRSIGFVFQAFHLLAHRSVIENVMLAEVYQDAPRSEREDRAAEALERVDLAHRARFLPTRLSGGERQRVAIARALMGEPDVFLCDEPTGNLDSATAERILDLFALLHAQRVTMITITHSDMVAQRAGRRVRIVDGVLSEEASLIGTGVQGAQRPRWT